MLKHKTTDGSLDVGLALHNFELEVGNNHTDIVSSEFEVGQVSDFGRILLIPVVFLPSGLTFVH